MTPNQHSPNALPMSANAIIESTKGLVSFYEPLSILVEQNDCWDKVYQYSAHLEQYPRVMSALSRLNANSMMDFEKGLACGLLSIIVGQRLQLEAKRIRALFFAALTQDTGAHLEEYTVSDYFLGLKERFGGKLRSVGGDETTELNRAHALVSYSLLEEAIPDDLLVAELVLHHHANEDGTGYPANVSEQQLSTEMQILIVANRICDAMQSRGGFDELFRLCSELKLASTMYFGEVNGAFYGVLNDASTGHAFEPVVVVNEEKLKRQVEVFKVFSDSALMLNSALIPFDHFRTVSLIRLKIRKIDLLINESAILQSAETGCLHEAAQCIEALPEFLRPLLGHLKEAQKVLPKELKTQTAELRAQLKQAIAALQPPKPFSLFI